MSLTLRDAAVALAGGTLLTAAAFPAVVGVEPVKDPEGCSYPFIVDGQESAGLFREAMASTDYCACRAAQGEADDALMALNFDTAYQNGRSTPSPVVASMIEGAKARYKAAGAARIKACTPRGVSEPS